jgi:hypothetical protein
MQRVDVMIEVVGNSLKVSAVGFGQVAVLGCPASALIGQNGRIE